MDNNEEQVLSEPADLDEYEVEFDDDDFDDETPRPWYSHVGFKVAGAVLAAAGVLGIGIHVGRNAEEIAPSYFCPDAAEEVAASLAQEVLKHGASGRQLAWFGDQQPNLCYRYWLNFWGEKVTEQEDHDEDVQKYFDSHPPKLPKALDPRAAVGSGTVNNFGATGPAHIEENTIHESTTSNSMVIGSGSTFGGDSAWHCQGNTCTTEIQ